MNKMTLEDRVKLAATRGPGKTTRVQHMSRIVELETENRVLKSRLRAAEEVVDRARGGADPNSKNAARDYDRKWRVTV